MSACVFFGLPAWLQLVVMLVYVAFFEASLGAVLWIYSSETTTDRGVGLALGSNWLFTVLIGLLFPYASRELGFAVVFLIFSGFCLLALVFTLVWVVETKGLSSYEVRKKYYA